MNYRILLTGNHVIEVTEEQKNQVVKIWSDKSQDTIQIGGEMVDTSAIKAILKGDSTSQERHEAQDERMREINRQFIVDCIEWSKKTPEEKTQREIDIRILSGWKLGKGDEGDEVLAKAYDAILEFFKVNPKYPRCPSKIWWPILTPKLKQNPYLSKWFEYVFRNDQEIERWIKWGN